MAAHTSVASRRSKCLPCSCFWTRCDWNRYAATLSEAKTHQLPTPNNPQPTRRTNLITPGQPSQTVTLFPKATTITTHFLGQKPPMIVNHSFPARGLWGVWEGDCERVSRKYFKYIKHATHHRLTAAADAVCWAEINNFTRSRVAHLNCVNGWNWAWHFWIFFCIRGETSTFFLHL